MEQWQELGGGRQLRPGNDGTARRAFCAFAETQRRWRGGGSTGLARALASVSGVKDRLQLATRIEDRRWNLVFENGATVRLPADKKMPAAVQRLATLQQRSELLERPVISIDLRDADRVFIKPVVQTASSDKPEAA